MAQKKETREKPAEKAPSEEETKAPAITEKGKELAQDMDKLMDEIDDVLEKNAEEFVKNYVQKGGQ
ncbi:MAG: ubiquitin-like protein Pup [Nitrospirota bacterium]|nr:ubiquitin-like protein Pup [Nitrospirota bacterium]